MIVLLSVLIPVVVIWVAVREWRRRRKREHEWTRQQWLRYLSTGQPVQLEPLTDGNKYHLFLSHSWLSDRMLSE